MRCSRREIWRILNSEPCFCYSRSCAGTVQKNVASVSPPRPTIIPLKIVRIRVSLLCHFSRLRLAAGHMVTCQYGVTNSYVSEPGMFVMIRLIFILLAGHTTCKVRSREGKTSANLSSQEELARSRPYGGMWCASVIPVILCCREFSGSATREHT